MSKRAQKELKTIEMKDMELASCIQANPSFKESILHVSEMLKELRDLGYTLEDDEEYDSNIHGKLNKKSS